MLNDQIGKIFDEFYRENGFINVGDNIDKFDWDHSFVWKTKAIRNSMKTFC